MLDQPKPYILALANQKGGVGKTTTAINLGAALAEAGHRVLIIDMDPQGNASTGLGVLKSDRRETTYDILSGASSVRGAMVEVGIPGLYLVPGTTDLSSIDLDLVSDPQRITKLAPKLAEQELDVFDVILIDCPPALNLLTINALTAAHGVLVPLQCEFFALEGLSQLMLTIRQVRKGVNTSLRTLGVVLTMYDVRNNLSGQVEQDARENLGALVFRTKIPRNVRLSEAPSHFLPVLQYDSRSAGSQAYRALAQEVLERLETGEQPAQRSVEA
ncbi:MAG: ParA family protein [Pseudomonadota bacterium]